MQDLFAGYTTAASTQANNQPQRIETYNLDDATALAAAGISPEDLLNAHMTSMAGALTAILPESTYVLRVRAVSQRGYRDDRGQVQISSTSIAFTVVENMLNGEILNRDLPPQTFYLKNQKDGHFVPNERGEIELRRMALMVYTAVINQDPREVLEQMAEAGTTSYAALKACEGHYISAILIVDNGFGQNPRASNKVKDDTVRPAPASYQAAAQGGAEEFDIE